MRIISTVELPEGDYFIASLVMVDGRLCTPHRKICEYKLLSPPSPTHLYRRRKKRIGNVVGVARRDYDAADRPYLLGTEGG